jgi:pimeloyl-ACP methyl ester carboxylesterase
MPPTLKQETGAIVADGDLVIVHGRFSEFGATGEHWDLPVCFGVLRRRLEAAGPSGHGTRTFIRVLRLLEAASLPRLTDAVDYALDIGIVDPASLRVILENRADRPVDLFSLDGRPHLSASVQADRSQFWKDVSRPFYSYDRPGATVSEGVHESFWLQGMMAGYPAAYFCIKAFSGTDQTEDLQKFGVPTLILQGDDDQIVPFADAAQLQAKLIKGEILTIYKGAPHRPCTTHKDRVNENLLAFLKA